MCPLLLQQSWCDSVWNLGHKGQDSLGRIKPGLGMGKKSQKKRFRLAWRDYP